MTPGSRIPNPETPSDFLYPPDLFDRRPLETTDHRSLITDHHPPRFWTCVRSRPRWEKKFVQWLRSQGLPHFLPVYLKTTVSHRKKRTTTLPLFPGYVFVAEDVSKTDLSKSGSVVRLLKPASEADAAVLDRQLYSVWLAVRSGQTMAPLAELVPGQHIEITEGPMRGMEGIYIREGRGGSLILEVDMLSSAIRVGIPPDCRFQIRN